MATTNIQIIDGKLREIIHSLPTDRTAIPPAKYGEDFISQATLDALAKQFGTTSTDIVTKLLVERKLTDNRIKD